MPVLEKRSPPRFPGTGRTLTGRIIEPEPKPVVVNVWFWNNGFSVDNGPLRKYDDPQEASFLESIGKNVAPAEFLDPAHPKKEICFHNRNLEYTRPEPKITFSPFSSLGRRLGRLGESSHPTTTPPVPAQPPSPAQPNQFPSVGRRLGQRGSHVSLMLMNQS